MPNRSNLTTTTRIPG